MKLHVWPILIVLAVFINITKFCFAYEKKADGIVLKIKDKNECRLVKIQVCTEKIIRVIVSPVDSFSSRASLIVDKTEWVPVQWSVNEENENLILKTSNLSLKINPETAAITFYDASGKVLLQEKPENSFCWRQWCR